MSKRFKKAYRDGRRDAALEVAQYCDALRFINLGRAADGLTFNVDVFDVLSDSISAAKGNLDYRVNKAGTGWKK